MSTAPKRRRRYSADTYRTADEIVARMAAETAEADGQLIDALFEFGYATGVNLNHPQLARMAYLLMVDEMTTHADRLAADGDTEAAHSKLERMYDAHRDLLGALWRTGDRRRTPRNLSHAPRAQTNVVSFYEYRASRLEQQQGW